VSVQNQPLPHTLARTLTHTRTHTNTHSHARMHAHTTTTLYLQTHMQVTNTEPDVQAHMQLKI
jgi:hypothetical protein